MRVKSSVLLYFLPDASLNTLFICGQSNDYVLNTHNCLLDHEWTPFIFLESLDI